MAICSEMILKESSFVTVWGPLYCTRTSCVESGRMIILFGCMEK